MISYLDFAQLGNLVLAATTCVLALYLTATYAQWTKRLKHSRTSLRPLVFSMALAKGVLAFWTGSNVVNIVWLDTNLPLITLPARALWLLVVVVQVWVTLRVRPAPMLPTSLEDELDRDGRLVLIVDDNEATCRVYRRILEQVGINAEFATSGEDALTIIGMEMPRLLIVDVGLPGMNGVELAHRARGIGYKGPIIAATGYSKLATDLEEAGFSQVVGKPLRAADLVSVVQRWAG